LLVVSVRLVFELEAITDNIYDLRYHHSLQGFVYRLLKHAGYVGVHDAQGYKFFSFSNIYPPRDAAVGERRSLIIASPDPGMVVAMKTATKRLHPDGQIRIGKSEWAVRGLELVGPRIGRSGCVKTGTPIVIRIPKDRYTAYGIKPDKDYEYLYWRPPLPLAAFRKQIEDNLYKKYRDYYGRTGAEMEGRGRREDESTILEEIQFRKQVCNHILINGSEVKVIGTLWEFHFKHLDGEKREIVKFGVDAGFGEMNSLGFGFMNVARGSCASPSLPVEVTGRG